MYSEVYVLGSSRGSLGIYIPVYIYVRSHNRVYLSQRRVRLGVLHDPRGVKQNRTVQC